MEIGIVTIFPEIFGAVSGFGMTRRALESGNLAFSVFDVRDYASDRRRTVDDRPYGGGPGMVLTPGPLAECIDAARQKVSGPVVYLTPQGEQFDQGTARELAGLSGLILLCGRYEGVDERIVETRVDREISIGDYVLSGGEFPAMVIVDAVARLLPGVVGNEKSVLEDSFNEGMLDCPHYTRPENFEGLDVPKVLLSGNHEEIRQWRMEQALERTRVRRPDLVRSAGRSETEN
ncbi:MAG: tRNA (guanosine(37)-N1)-methyltransferase TrmD [Gammaproteobacteria bacterium]|nr:tRNA (guanosine(37)-N1)-methyltransferase TrmD [Gammaproteobacteria bacterium]MYD75242.1 tRNA (guanosine(37)-N1)-methyltransferase TrmD [Gammaproteobacteria bacterium]